jgi:Zn-dependent membrane protease YugP
MFQSISKKVTFIVAAIVTVLLVLEPTSNLTVEVLSIPSNLAWMLLGFLVGIINWPMLAMIAIGFAVAFTVKTRSVDWSELKGLFNKEEA